MNDCTLAQRGTVWLKLLYFEWSPPWHFKSYILTYILTFYLTFYLTSILIFYLAYLPAFYLVYILAFYHIWHIFWHSMWHSFSHIGPWLRSSGAHCAQNLAVEVQPCPLSSEAGSWGPALPTARKLAKRLAKSWQGGSGRGNGGRGGGGEGGGAGTAVIKSNNPHLAGGEKLNFAPRLTKAHYWTAVLQVQALCWPRHSPECPPVVAKLP